MLNNEDARLIESILYLENEPLSIERLAEMTGLTELEINTAINDLAEEYYQNQHGLSLIESAETYQFVPSANLEERLRYCYGKKIDKRLSKAAIETLSIVAYAQPITRNEISKIRGVVSDSIVRILRDREYIKVISRKNVQGHPCQYGTTKKFLYTFKLNSISELPKLSEIDRQRFEKAEKDGN